MSLKVIMFPGQGSQFQGMGEDLFREFPEVVATATKVLGYDIEDLCMLNPLNRLNETSFTQPALFTVNYLSYQKYLQKNKVPDYFLGHSLGEFNALNAAGVFDFETGLKIVQKRGELMFSIKDSGMAVVIGADHQSISSILEEKFPDVDIANINTPSQIVISGKMESLNKAETYFEDEGLAYIPLNVSGAFHSRYMTPVKDQFKNFVETIQVKKGNIPIVSNYSATMYPPEPRQIINNMVNQIDNPVFWFQSIEYLLNYGECQFIEVGPGEILSNLVKKIRISTM